jgi:hypothetical protein
MVHLEKGIAWVKDTSKIDGRKGFNTLEEALQNAQPACCGIDCKCGVLRLPDRVTGETVNIGVVNGVLRVLDSNLDPITPNPLVGPQGPQGAQGAQGPQGEPV